MPAETSLTHAHRYSSYLLDLSHSWAYAGTARTPGRDRNEKKLTAAIKRPVKTADKE